MKLYSVRNWVELFENNRSKTVKDLAWVKIPNRHDGENFSAIMLHKKGAEIFSAWVLVIQVASRCHPRGTLVRDNGKPHTPETLSIKTRAPASWFEIALPFLEKETDWLDVQHIASDCQEADSLVTSGCQAGDEERREEKERRDDASLPPFEDILQGWNAVAPVKCLAFSDKRRRHLEARWRDAYFRENWADAIVMIGKSDFCGGKNERGWKASFDWFLQPDTVVKAIEGKYQSQTPPTTKHPGKIAV